MDGSHGWIGTWSPEIGDPTVVGWLTVVCYAWVVWLCCKILWLDHKRKIALEREEKLLWWMFVVGLLLLGANKQLDLQTALIEIGRRIAVNQGWYEMRREFQAWFIGVVGLVALVMCFFLAHMARGSAMSTRVALAGFFLLLTFVLVRAASFEHFDALVYHRMDTTRINWVLEIGSLLIIGLSARLRMRYIWRVCNSS